MRFLEKNSQESNTQDEKPSNFLSDEEDREGVEK